MAKLATEAAGAFFLVLVAGLTIVQGVPLAPLAIGSTLMVMVYFGGHISGAHYNPAVSVAFLLRGKLGRDEALPYIAAQLAGALAGAFLARGLAGEYLAVAPGAGVSALTALVAEAVFTALLVAVILNVATSPRTEGNGYYGLAIGFTLAVTAFAIGGISGGVLNPAVGTGAIAAAMLGGGSLGDLWLYWAGPLAGAVLGFAFYQVQHRGESKSE